MPNKQFNLRILFKSVYNGIYDACNNNEAVAMFFVIIASILITTFVFGTIFTLILSVIYIVPYLADYVDYMLGKSYEFNCIKDHTISKLITEFFSNNRNKVLIKDGCGHGLSYLFLIVLFLTLTPFVSYVIYQIYRSVTRKYNEEIAAHTA